jgi:hypothetical protein
MDDDANAPPPRAAEAAAKAESATVRPARDLAAALTSAVGSLAALRAELLQLHARLETAQLIRRLRDRSRR